MLTLIRDKRTADAVLGRLYLGGVLVCYTCENRAKAIPAGSSSGVTWIRYSRSWSVFMSFWRLS